MRRLIEDVLKNLNQDHISEYSAQCAYFAILSFIPFIIVMLSMVQYTGIDQSVFINFLSNLIPKSIDNVIIKIVEEVYQKSTGRLSISLIFTLWSAGKVVYALSKGFKNILKIEEKNFFYLRFGAIMQTLLFIILIVAVISIIKIGDKLSVFFLIFFLLFLLYRVLSKNKITLKSQLLGAMISSILLFVVSIIFTVYLEWSKNFSIVYGSLTSLIFIMMWIYVSFYIIFLGVEIAKIV